MVTLTGTVIRPLIIGLSVVIIIFLLIITRPESQAELQPLPPVSVYTESVKKMDIHPVSRITGQLQAARKAELRFEVPGIVVARDIEPGQAVTAGEVLMKLDDADFVDAVARARSLLQQEQDAVARDRHLLKIATEQVDLQQREVDRMQKLGRESLASRSKYDETLGQLLQQKQDMTRLQYSLNSADARIAERKSDLDTAQRNLDRSSLVAPFAGIINAVSVDQGDYVSVNQVATELVQVDKLDLYLEVTGSVARYLSLGESIEISSDNIKTAGTLIAIALEPDPVTHTYGLRIRVPAGKLHSGQLAVALLPGEPLPQALVVPVSAVLQEEGRAYVFVVNDDRLSRKEVSLVERQGNLQAIDGVKAGQKIVVRDVAVLADNQEVQSRPE